MHYFETHELPLPRKRSFYWKTRRLYLCVNVTENAYDCLRKIGRQCHVEWYRLILSFSLQNGEREVEVRAEIRRGKRSNTLQGEALSLAICRPIELSSVGVSNLIITPRSYPHVIESVKLVKCARCKRNMRIFLSTGCFSSICRRTPSVNIFQPFIHFANEDPLFFHNNNNKYYTLVVTITFLYTLETYMSSRVT